MHEFFATHSLITDPGEQAFLFDGLPRDISRLRRVVQGLLLHIFWADRYGEHLTPERQAEVQLRSVRRQLSRIVEHDPCPLNEARPPSRRLVGNCRDFSVMLASMLRHQGVPARARCGFGVYFLPNHFEDHWVCEYWNAAQGRWVLVDAQLDEFQCDKVKVGFDPLDVPRDQFVVAGLAWQMCRGGQADPDAFGIHDMHGLWFVRGDLGRDIASINKMELLPWDCWGIVEAPEETLTDDDMVMLDEVAALTAGDVPNFEAVRAMYESDARLRVPPAIHSYTQAGMKTVEVCDF